MPSSFHLSTNLVGGNPFQILSISACWVPKSILINFPFGFLNTGVLEFLKCLTGGQLLYYLFNLLRILFLGLGILAGFARFLPFTYFLT